MFRVLLREVRRSLVRDRRFTVLAVALLGVTIGTVLALYALKAE